MNGYGIVTEPGTVRFVRTLPGTIEQVWSYLVESEKRGKWLASGEMELSEGGRVELYFRHADLSPQVESTPERYREMEGGHACHGRITRCDPPRLLSFTWDEDSGEATEVTFELTAQREDTLLVLTHRRLDGRDAMLSVASGWHAHLDILAEVLRGLTPAPFWSRHRNLEEEYDRHL
jgi:uncharacterized protein YndB with AHSA1/START domain